ncbi:MAG: hypothetical protein RLZZ214_407, partial [Verrucomicrobiota bacterium]
LSGRTYARMIPQWKQAGYQVVLFFLQLPSEDLAVARVADRVSQGGHDIPEAVIRRRFHAGIANFHALYKPLVDDWRLYDHSGERPILICSSNPS